MFGFKLIHQSVLEMKEERWKEKLEVKEGQLADARHMLGRMEAELHYWQERADGERERADRLNDVVMQQNGLPDVTPTVIKEKKKREEETKDVINKHEEELAEMFSDNFDGEDELNWIDPDLRDAANGWMATAKKARKEKKNSEIES